MHRDELIEKLVSKYRDVLEEKDDEDLLGSTALEQVREQAAESLVESYRECVEDMEDAELLGEGLIHMRDAAIEALTERYEEELGAMTDDELEEEAESNADTNAETFKGRCPNCGGNEWIEETTWAWQRERWLYKANENGDLDQGMQVKQDGRCESSWSCAKCEFELSHDSWDECWRDKEDEQR